MITAGELKPSAFIKQSIQLTGGFYLISPVNGYDVPMSIYDRVEAANLFSVFADRKMTDNNIFMEVYILFHK